MRHVEVRRLFRDAECRGLRDGYLDDGYQLGGKQYLVVAIGVQEYPAELLAFRLPE